MRQFICWLKFILEPFVLYKREVSFRRSIIYTRYLRNESIRDKTIMYEVNKGMSAGEGPRAIYQELAEGEQFRHIWVYSGELDEVAGYPECQNVELVKIYSRKYFKYLSSAKYLVNNLDFPPFFQKKEGQIYINTLTSYPITDSKQFSNIQRNLLHTDILVAKDVIAANKMLDIYKIRNLFNGKILSDRPSAIIRIFDKDYKVKKKESHKKNILLYCGGFLNNGITTSAINLLNHIDYARYNVVLIEKQKTDREFLLNIKRVNKQADILYRVGRMNMSFFEYYCHKYITRQGLKSNIAKRLLPENLYEREYKRLFGNLKIDVAVDFSGYVPFWGLVFAHGTATRKIIYQHNDMLEESKKIVNQQLKHKEKMNIIFPLYHRFDKIISVAEYTKELNVKNLSKFIPEEKASFVHNCINHKEVLKQADDYGEGECSFLLPNPQNINFLNIGRLSPEKDQKKLIKAFSKISLIYPEARLYISGDGPLFKELKMLRDHLGLQEKIIFTGHLSNPFYLFKQCDCFILSSNHEGQPMVLLEALVLNKPIISTDLPGTRGIIEEHDGELVENSEAGLIQGIENFMEGKVSSKPFNYKAYNKQALAMFYHEVCGESKELVAVKKII